MIALLLSPIGRYLMIGGLIVMAVGGFYLKVRSDAKAEIEAAAQADVLRRTQDALRAGDTIDVHPDRLRESDRNARD
jgi:hypothetical protein